MKLHPSTFDYLKPTAGQLQIMEALRRASAEYVAAVTALVPDGPDKTYIIRSHRQTAMWVNCAVTRAADGEPLTDLEEFTGDRRVIQMNIEAAVHRAKQELGLIPAPKYEEMAKVTPLPGGGCVVEGKIESKS